MATLGGAALVGHEIAGVWRARTSGSTLRLEVEEWTSWSAATRSGVDNQWARLAEFRGLRFEGMTT